MAESKFEEKKASLSPLEYQVVVNKGTERPFSNKYNRHWEIGTYHCVVCNQELFKSESKFESKSGWPAFSNVINKESVKYKTDTSNVGMNLLLLATRPDLARTEVSCALCNAHLGHLFKDGPKSSGGLRFCINSASLTFVPACSSITEKCRNVTTNGPFPSEETCSNGSSKNAASTGTTRTPCGIGKICFFSPRKEDMEGGGGIQRISTNPRPLPILRETTL